MAKTKHHPGIHLLITEILRPNKGKYKINDDMKSSHVIRKEFYWQIVSRNGRIIARSSETYTRKGNAVKSIKTAAMIFMHKYHVNGATYYDHSQPDSPLKSYL